VIRIVAGISIFFQFFVLASTLSASKKMRIIYCPSDFHKGEISIVKLQGIKKKSEYFLVSETPSKRTNKPLLLKKQASFLIGVPEDAGKILRMRIFRDGIMIVSNEFPLYERTRKQISFSLDKKFIVPDPKIGPRIKREAELLKEARQHYSDSIYFDNSPVFPVTNQKLGSLFGERRTLNGVKQSVHYGVDISSRTGDLVRGVFPGVVILAEDLFYGGQTVMIEHGFGLISQYSHLSKMLVKQGDFVTNAMVVGHVGSTGMSTGPHLHLSFYYRNYAVDPLSVMSYMRELW